jgi:hypothetical protein
MDPAIHSRFVFPAGGRIPEFGAKIFRDNPGTSQCAQRFSTGCERGGSQLEGPDAGGSSAAAELG